MWCFCKWDISERRLWDLSTGFGSYVLVFSMSKRLLHVLYHAPYWYQACMPCKVADIKLTRQAVYVWRNIEARSRNNCCRKKAVSLTYLCVCVCFCECVRVRSCVCGCGCTNAGVCLRACSLTNPAFNAPPYCHLRPLWLHHIFHIIS